MKRKAVAIISLLVSLTCLAAETATVTPEPYGPTEFPPWQKDLRRAEIIAFGSLPFITFFSSIGYDVYRYTIHNGASGYEPWPFKNSSTEIELTDDEEVKIIMISAGISIGVAIFDYSFRALMRAIKDSEAEKHNREIPDPIHIEPIAPDPGILENPAAGPSE